MRFGTIDLGLYHSTSTFRQILIKGGNYLPRPLVTLIIESKNLGIWVQVRVEVVIPETLDLVNEVERFENKEEEILTLLLVYLR